MSDPEVNDALQRIAQERQSACAHTSVQPAYDHEAARGLSASVVRKRWPRFMGTCPDCGGRWILYASGEHYAAGDW